MPSLPVLARLPDVSLAADKGKPAIRLDWLTQLDWKAMRRLKLDPNWVAGGVLGLVLLLLVVITLNRGSKPTAPGDVEPSSWQGATAHAPSSQNTSIAEGAPAKKAPSSPSDSATQFNSPARGTLLAGQSAEIPPSQAVADANRTSLEGIYYPRTPHGTDNSNVAQAATQPTVFPPAASGYDNGIRTAQRDPFVSRGQQPTSVQPGYVQPAHAQLDGFITQPQGIRHP